MINPDGNIGLSINGDTVQINNAEINMEDIEVNLWFYSQCIEEDKNSNGLYANYKQTSIDNVKEYLNDPQNNKDKIDSFVDYSNWYINKGNEYTENFENEYYRNELDKNKEKSYYGKKYDGLTVSEKKEVIMIIKDII